MQVLSPGNEKRSSSRRSSVATKKFLMNEKFKSSLDSKFGASLVFTALLANLADQRCGPNLHCLLRAAVSSLAEFDLMVLP